MVLCDGDRRHGRLTGAGVGFVELQRLAGRPQDARVVVSDDRARVLICDEAGLHAIQPAGACAI
jgi:hypothetical protein